MKKLVSVLLVLILAAGICVFVLDDAVRRAEKDIVAPEAAAGAQCIIVLGCKVKSDGTPSDMLADRLDTGIALYKQGAAPKLLLSGDHGTVEYDEVNAMLAYALAAGVPDEDIFLDHAGFCTYDTVYRAKAVFGVTDAIFVTQTYHLGRTLYIAGKLGIDAVGVSADRHTYRGQLKRDMRELFARDKDFLSCVFKPQSRYVGDPIDINGSGLVTRDR